MAAKLFLFGVDLREAAPAIAAIWGIDPQQQKLVRDLNVLAKEIGQHKQLDELVLYFHGYSGGIILGNGSYKLSDQKIANAFANTKTEIGHIRFEGCFVGKAPDEMAAFGRLFGAHFVSGYTWAGWTGDITLKFYQGNTPAQVEKALEPYARWLMPGAPTPAQIASQARQGDITKKLWMLWYQETLQKQPPYLNNNYQKLGKHNYKARSDANKRTILKAQADEDKTGADPPVTPFEYVTVSGFMDFLPW